MLRTAAYALLLLVPLALCQQHGGAASPHLISTNSAQAQPTATPGNTQTEANSRIKRSIDDLLEGDELLKGADIQTTVDDENITLSGTVKNYAQHQRALAVAQQYARWRRIVDKLSTQQNLGKP